MTHTYTLEGTKILRETWDGNTLIPLYDNEDSVCGIREIIYYPDKLIITYNFSDAIDTINLTPENAKEIEQQSKSAFSLDIGSSICQYSSPNPRKHHEKWCFFFFSGLATRTLIKPSDVCRMGSHLPLGDRQACLPGVERANIRPAKFPYSTL